MAASYVIDRWSKTDNKTGYRLQYLLKKIRCGRCKSRHSCQHGPYMYVRKYEVKNGKLRCVEHYVGKPGSAAFTLGMTADPETISMETLWK